MIPTTKQTIATIPRITAAASRPDDRPPDSFTELTGSSMYLYLVNIRWVPIGCRRSGPPHRLLLRAAPYYISPARARSVRNRQVNLSSSCPPGTQEITHNVLSETLWC